MSSLEALMAARYKISAGGGIVLKPFIRWGIVVEFADIIVVVVVDVEEKALKGEKRSDIIIGERGS